MWPNSWPSPFDLGRVWATVSSYCAGKFGQLLDAWEAACGQQRRAQV